MCTNYTLLFHFSWGSFQRDEFMILLITGEREKGVDCAWVTKRKEPEIVAQMNLKYCRILRLFTCLRWIDALLDFPLSYFSFHAFARGTVSPGTVFFLPPHSLLFIIVTRSCFRSSLFHPKVAFSCDWLDRFTQPHIRAQRPYEFAWYNDKSEWMENHNKIIDSNVILCACRSDDLFRSRRLAKLTTKSSDEIGKSCSCSIIESM